MMKQLVFSLFILILCLATACESTAGGDASASSEPIDSKTTKVEETTEPTRPALKRNQNVAFDEILKQGNVSFTISSPNVPERNTMVIFSEGLELRNDTFQLEVQGIVNDAQLADVNGDTFPEVYVFTQQKDNDQLGEVYVFTSYRNRSFGQAFFKEVPRANSLSTATNTTDRFKLEGGKLVREIGTATEGNAVQAESATTTITYELRPGEASFQLIPLQQSN
jgi:hypothetical protein